MYGRWALFINNTFAMIGDQGGPHLDHDVRALVSGRSRRYTFCSGRWQHDVLVSRAALCARARGSDAIPTMFRDMPFLVAPRAPSSVILDLYPVSFCFHEIEKLILSARYLGCYKARL
jgi:hypothetical protein